MIRVVVLSIINPSWFIPYAVRHLKSNNNGEKGGIGKGGKKKAFKKSKSGVEKFGVVMPKISMNGYC